jgi:hypothetical protein
MKCPHCSVTVHLHFIPKELTFALNEKERAIGWEALHGNCPSCGQAVIFLQSGETGKTIQGATVFTGQKKPVLVWPQSSARPCPKEVPADIASDFNEAVRVLPISPQASAALTRRSLQQILRDHGKTKSKDLFDQIEEIIKQGHVPHALADQLNAVRVIGNFAAHPLKSQSTGTIMPVEPEEAEWNLDVLEAAFDHYFVKPAQAQARKAALNKKLAEAGKPPLT